MIVKDINTGRFHLFECFEKGNWTEVPEEQIQMFQEGNNIGVSEDGAYISDVNGMRLVSAVLNIESCVEWLSYHLSQAALANGNPLLAACVVRQMADASMGVQCGEEEENMLDLIKQLQAIGKKYRLPIPPYPKTGEPIDEQQASSKRMTDG